MHAYFNKLPVAGVEQHLRHLRAVFAFGEFVIVTFFDDAALICWNERLELYHRLLEIACD